MVPEVSVWFSTGNQHRRPDRVETWQLCSEQSVCVGPEGASGPAGEHLL